MLVTVPASTWRWSVFEESDSRLCFLLTGELKGRFDLEPGIHRVQRVPPTERGGRRHTSTIAVALMPCPSNEEIRTCEKDFKIVCCVGTGPGGQHRNKTCSAVRVTHLKTGVTAYADTRSQHNSRRLAMAVVLERLKEQQTGQRHSQHNDLRRVQIGSMGRGTRVRTYNFIDNRVTDERIKKSFCPEDIMKGGLERIYSELGK